VPVEHQQTGWQTFEHRLGGGGQQLVGSQGGGQRLTGIGPQDADRKPAGAPDRTAIPDPRARGAAPPAVGSHFGLAFLTIGPADIPAFLVAKIDPLRWIALVGPSRRHYEQLLSKAAH
jgi:hypothetical protein